jgi:hypothetical protein
LECGGLDAAVIQTLDRDQSGVKPPHSNKTRRIG